MMIDPVKAPQNNESNTFLVEKATISETIDGIREIISKIKRERPR